MRTSLLDSQQIEEHLLKKSLPEDQLLFQARLILEPGLQAKCLAQEEIYGLIQTYGRQKLREEIANVHSHLFHSFQHRSFKANILRLFKR